MEVRDTALVAVMAAIIYAGADDNRGENGYSPEQAVNVAAAILTETQRRAANPPTTTQAASA
jgi:hypothetical protein